MTPYGERATPVLHLNTPSHESGGVCSRLDHLNFVHPHAWVGFGLTELCRQMLHSLCDEPAQPQGSGMAAVVASAFQ